jgi:hypothetical protein
MYLLFEGDFGEILRGHLHAGNFLQLCNQRGQVRNVPRTGVVVAALVGIYRADLDHYVHYVGGRVG